MSAIVTDMGANEMIRYKLASNDRDAMKAEALAESSTNLARLLLAMQDAVQPLITQLASSGIPLPAHTFWQLVPLDSELLKGLTRASCRRRSAWTSVEPTRGAQGQARSGRRLDEKTATFDPEKDGVGKEPFEPPEGGFGAFDGTFKADIQTKSRRPSSLRGWTKIIPPAECFARASACSR